MSSVWQSLSAIESSSNYLLSKELILNKPLLMEMYDCLKKETLISQTDYSHIETIIQIASRLEIGPIDTAKQFIEKQVFIESNLKGSDIKDLTNSLSWLFRLLQKYRPDPSSFDQRVWQSIWLNVSRFDTQSYPIACSYVYWLEQKDFSPKSICDHIQAFYKFHQWLKPTAIVQVTNDTLQTYLAEKYGSSKPITQKRVLSFLKPIFHFYKETIEPLFDVPNYTIKAHQPLGLSESATSQQVEQLWEALKLQKIGPEAGLILFLVIGYGLRLKHLPSIRVIDSAMARISYTNQLPSNLGIKEQQLDLDLELNWVQYLWHPFLSRSEGDFLFQTHYSKKRGLPVSTAHIQRTIKSVTLKFTQAPLPVNYLERAAIKLIAASKPLSEFLALSEATHLTHKTRLMIWLYAQINDF